MHEHSHHLGCSPPCSSRRCAAQAHKLPAELLLDMQVYQPPDAAALGRSAQAFVSFLNHAGACTGAELPASKLVLCRVAECIAIMLQSLACSWVAGRCSFACTAEQPVTLPITIMVQGGTCNLRKAHSDRQQPKPHRP